jgi:hypothetical protein
MKRVLAIVALAALGCSTHYIRGTSIPANEDTEAIISVMEKYRNALIAKDAPGVVKLLAPDFHDDAGTADPSDDISLANAQKVLGDRLAKITDFDLEIDVKGIDVKEGHAEAKYYYTEHFRIPSLTTNAQSESDSKKMTLVKVGNEWKISSGI